MRRETSALQIFYSLHSASGYLVTVPFIWPQLALWLFTRGLASELYPKIPLSRQQTESESSE